MTEQASARRRDAGPLVGRIGCGHAGVCVGWVDILIEEERKMAGEVGDEMLHLIISRPLSET